MRAPRHWFYSADWLVGDKVERFRCVVVETARARADVLAREEFARIAGHGGTRIPADWIRLERVVQEA